MAPDSEIEIEFLKLGNAGIEPETHNSPGNKPYYDATSPYYSYYSYYSSHSSHSTHSTHFSRQSHLGSKG